jgi:hypothetical protein
MDEDDIVESRMIDLTEAEYVTDIQWGVSENVLTSGPLYALNLTTTTDPYGPGERITRTVLITKSGWQTLKESIAHIDRIHPPAEDKPN